MSARRIGFLCTSHALGGLELNLAKLAGWVRDAGREVTFFAAPDRPLEAAARDRGLPGWPVRRRTRYADLLAAQAFARAAAKRGTRNVVVSTSEDIDLAVLSRSLFRGPRRIFYLQQMKVGVDKRDPIHTFKYRRLAAWIAPLPYLAEMARARTRMPRDRIHVVPLCIEMERFTEDRLSRDAARRALDLPADALLFGNVGRWDPQKGIHTLLAAFDRVAVEIPGAHLLLMGEPTRGEGAAYADEVQARARGSAAAARIHFRPFHPRVEEVYPALDAFVMSSVSEPFGMVTVEAMASGCPVVGTDAGGTPDLLEHGELGLLCASEDAGGMADAMLRLARDPDLRRALSERGSREVPRRYGHQVQVEDLLDLVDRAAGLTGVR